MRYIQKLWLVLLLAGLMSCGVAHKRDELEKNESDVSQQYSIKADREKLADLRSEIPEEQRLKNDEVAFVLELMKDERYSPSEVRSRFNKALRKKQNDFRDDMRKSRDAFKKKEKKDRKAFLDKLDDERDDFTSSFAGGDREARKDFYDAQDAKRKEFFADARDRQKDFEADHSQKRRDFNDYIKERRNFFNDELKVYTLRYKASEQARKEKEKALKESLRKQSQAPAGPTPKLPTATEINNFNSEFDQIPNTPAEPLNQ